MQLAPSTSTQGDESYKKHEIGVPPPLAGRPGASGELGSTPPKRDHHSTTMVRVPGSSSDSECHRESLSEDVMIKTEPGMEASKAKESPQTRESENFPIYQCSGKGSNDKKNKRKIDHSI